MSEQVQVREGVWRTRGGEQVEVRARDTTAFETEWRWYGERHGHMVTWRDDGTIHIERRTSNGDLVQFLRALPRVEAAPEPAPEPQPVQVREGIWKTRSGHAVEVRENSGQLAIDFPWRGALFGVMEIWRNNGQWLNNATCDHRDLVEYVGPLPHTEQEPEVEPEPQPTSELQPEQVCEGLWKTRSGQLVEVRARQDKVQTQYRWIGSIFGVAYRWRDDGRKSEGRDHHCDLVAYVGPLPQQTTTDTLAEIEDTVAEIEDDLPVNPFEECRRLRAEVCNLQQAHQTMTEHARELLESGQQARESQDNLRQQLETMTSERDEVANELRAMTDHCSRQQEQLQALTEKREQLTVLLSNAQCAHDMTQRQVQQLQAEARAANELLQNERLEAQQAHAGRKRAEEHLADMTADRDRLQAELRQAQIDLDAEREAPAANCRAVVDAHLVGAQNGRQAAFEAVERWLEPLAGVDSEHAAAVLQALPGCIRRLAELEGVTW